MKKTVPFKAIRVIVVLTLAMVIAGLLITFRPKAERVERTQTGLLVDVLPAQASDLHMSIQTFGTITPREALNLVAEVNGQVVHIHSAFTEGGFIGRGTLLARIDPRSYELEVERRRVSIEQIDAELKHLRQQVNNLQARIKIVDADVALARSEFFRLEKLSRNNVVARTTRDQTEQRYLASLEGLQTLENQLALTDPQKERLEAERKMARVLLQEATLDLERTRIVSPFDGWILERTVEEGQHVTVAQYLGKMYRAGALDIEVRIPLKDLRWLPDMSAPDVRPEAEIVADDFATIKRWQGKLARAKAQIDEKTRTLPVLIEMDPFRIPGQNPDDRYLKPGMFVAVNIKGVEVKQVFTLPRHMIYPGDVVYTVIDNRLRIRPVHVIRRFKDAVFVDSGLTNGDLLVKTPVPAVSEGMLVNVRHADG